MESRGSHGPRPGAPSTVDLAAGTDPLQPHTRGAAHRVLLRDCPSYDKRSLKGHVHRILSDAALEVRGKRILLKPSFVYPARGHEARAMSTQPELVAAVTHVLLERGAAAVSIAEDSLLGPSEVAFAAMGLARHLEGKGVVVPLQSCPRRSVEIDRPFVEARMIVPRLWTEADLFISLPKIKVNIYTDVTLSVKNNFGFLLLKDRLPNHHYHLHKKLADLYRVRPPDFVIVDSIVAGEGQGPMAADPVHLGVLLAGRNGVAVDSVACRLMGFEPRAIEHLRLLHSLGLGPLDLDEIDLENPSLLQARARVFRRPRLDFDDMAPHVRVVCGEHLCCPSGCAGMIRNSLDQWKSQGRLEKLSGFTFVAGKPIANLPPHDPAKTMIVGDCAIAHASAGTFIPGCPVAPLSIVAALAKKRRLVPLRCRYRDIAAGYLAHAIGRLGRLPSGLLG